MVAYGFGAKAAMPCRAGRSIERDPAPVDRMRMDEPVRQSIACRTHWSNQVPSTSSPVVSSFDACDGASANPRTIGPMPYRISGA